MCNGSGGVAIVVGCVVMMVEMEELAITVTVCDEHMYVMIMYSTGVNAGICDTKGGVSDDV